jgi:hypothetical protein
MKNSNRVALVMCLVFGASVPASANHSWGGYHWARSTSTLPLTVNTAITTGVWGPYVNTAIGTDWNNRSVLRLAGQTAPAGTSTKKCSPISGQLLVCNNTYGQRGWLGIATIWADGSKHITAATTKLNDSYFNSATYNKPEWRRLVACQEIGHDFGLAHQDETFGNVNLGSCMDYTNAPAGGIVGGFNYGPSNEHPNSHDTAQLNTIYSHTDAYNTNSASTNFAIREPGRPVAPALPDPGDSEAEWGTPVHHDGKGRPDEFVRRLANGGQMITHVFWALDVKGTNTH